jgi:hypothetical protein
MNEYYVALIFKTAIEDDVQTHQAIIQMYNINERLGWVSLQSMSSTLRILLLYRVSTILQLKL